MIEKSQLEPLLDLIQESSLEERLKVISALAVFQLTPAARRAVSTLAESGLNDLVAEGRLTEDELEILAPTPLYSIRERLHQLVEKITNHPREEITLFPLEQSNKSMEALAGISIIDTAEVKKLIQKLSRVAWNESRLNVDPHERALLKHLSPAETAELLQNALAQLIQLFKSGRLPGISKWSIGDALLDLATSLPDQVPLLSFVEVKSIGLGFRTRATFYSSSDPISVQVEHQISGALDPDRYEVELVNLSKQPARIQEAQAAGVTSVPALVINNIPFHINFGAPISALKDWGEFYLDEDQQGEIASNNDKAALEGRLLDDSAFGEVSEDQPKKRDAKFYFILRGEYARGAVILANSNAALEFHYDVAPIDVLATIGSQALETARTADIDIHLQLTARGSITIIGQTSDIAKFRGGNMLAPVIFQVHALAHEQGKASVHVDFSAMGELLHETELPITIVATKEEVGSSEKQVATNYTVPLTLIDNACRVSPPPNQRISLSLWFDRTGKLSISLTDIRDGHQVEPGSMFVAQTIDKNSLETLLHSVRAQLVSCYRDEIWSWYSGGPLPAHETKVVAAALSRTLDTVAVAGSRLNADLRTDPEIAKAIDYIEQSAALGAVITISTDEIFLPWEILYSGVRTANMTENQKKHNPVYPNRFWGVRFAFETLQRSKNGTRLLSLPDLRRIQFSSPPTVSINLNPTILVKDSDPANQPMAVQEAWAKRLSEKGVLGGIEQTCEDIRGVLQDAAKEATFIYVYCHGRSSSPFGGADETLVLDDNCQLHPQDLLAASPYKHAPIIFLNSCESGAFSPMTFSNFLREFRNLNALGMIVTTFSVPITFAAHFGQEIVECYLQRRGSLAVSMLELRQKYLERGNPVPLFYSLQCQIDFGAAATLDGNHHG